MKTGSRFNTLSVIPNPEFTQTGQIDFLSPDGTKSVAIGAPGSITQITLAISAAANSSGVLQCTVSSTGAMITGQSWYITGITGSGFSDDIYTITVINGTTFSINGITSSGSYFVSSASATQNTIWYLPSADGSAGNYMVTDGAGSLAWSNALTPTTPAYPVPVSVGVAQPDASKFVNILVETVDTLVSPPLGIPTGTLTIPWTLIIKQGTAGNSTTFDPSYVFSITASDADSLIGSTTTLSLSTDSTGSTALISMATT